MTITLYDLASADDRRFSPFCWRTRMALAHKGLEHVTVGVGFRGIRRIGDGRFRRVPVLELNGTWIDDSTRIAEELEARFPRPALFPTPAVRTLSRFIDDWAAPLFEPIGRIVVPDINGRVLDEDHPYFEDSRRRWLGMSFEAMIERRDDDLDEVRRALQPVRETVRGQPFLCGEEPGYPDYQVFGLFQWARTVCPVPLVTPDDPLRAWLERCLDLHGGVGRSSPACAW